MGRLETPMLYENGAQFVRPSRDRVETNAIGRGTKAEIMSRYESLSERCEGSTIVDIAAGRTASLDN
ncbi:MAG TPA: hypothetical protein VJ224_04065 [Thermoplasmata archaeon]|nr:hypothetical protein [Thermoplasmata archaeon]